MLPVANVSVNGPSIADCRNLANGAPTVNRVVVYLMALIVRKRIAVKLNNVTRLTLLNVMNDPVQLPIVINAAIWGDACGHVR
jgi:hypothetical protein